jgi:hypothetical protein
MIINVPLRKKTYDVDVTVKEISILVIFKYDNTTMIEDKQFTADFINRLNDEDGLIDNSKLVPVVQNILKDVIHKYNSKRYLMRLEKERRNHEYQRS